MQIWVWSYHIHFYYMQTIVRSSEMENANASFKLLHSCRLSLCQYACQSNAWCQLSKCTFGFHRCQMCLSAGMTHWQSPNFFAYYPANSSFPGILGEMLSAAFNVIGFSWRGCPAATDLETVRSPLITKSQNYFYRISRLKFCKPKIIFGNNIACRKTFGSSRQVHSRNMGHTCGQLGCVCYCLGPSTSNTTLASMLRLVTPLMSLQVVLDWFAKLLNLPEAFLATQADGSRGKGGGVISGTASEACLVALLAAKCRKMQSRPAEDSLKLVAYFSDQSHGCALRACKIAGIVHRRALPTTSQNPLPTMLMQQSMWMRSEQQRLTTPDSRRKNSALDRTFSTGEDGWALNPAAFKQAVQSDIEAGLLPFFLCATLGSTPTCAVDPISSLGLVSQSHGIWWVGMVSSAQQFRAKMSWPLMFTSRLDAVHTRNERSQSDKVQLRLGLSRNPKRNQSWVQLWQAVQSSAHFL